MKPKNWLKKLLMGKYMVVEHEAFGNVQMRIFSGDEYLITQEKIIVNLHAHIDRLEKSRGMSLRDYFAGKALSGCSDDFPSKPEVLAEWAYSLADAMLKERKK